MVKPLIPPRTLFRFSTPCRRVATLWGAKGANLDDTCALPNFADLDGPGGYADFRAAWSDQGMVFSVRVSGKKRAVYCDEQRLHDSDGVQVWIDTRDTHNVHRASRYCHRFICLPSGGGPRRDQPVADQMLINRARENARPVRPHELKCRSERRVDGYLLELCIPAGVLTGFEPSEHPRLGFTYVVLDQELGEQAFTVGGELPYDEDPSLWGSLELVP